MIRRTISARILKYASQYPVVTITGPRQSGKTTLCKMLFPNYKYVNLENPATFSFAAEDPVAFIGQFGDSGVIVDEIQRVPILLSAIQVKVDDNNENGRFILTGSHNLRLMESVSQSLAGRTALATLLPLSLSEAYGANRGNLFEVLYRGLYPRVISQGLDPSEALSFYIETYLERDVRDLVNVRDFVRFSTFLRLAAGRTAQLLNLSSLASDSGITVKTASEWLSVLEASYVVRRLPPWFANISKRLSKTPKLYFVDTGLVCRLLGITSAEQLFSNPLRGAIFETMVMNEYWKAGCNMGDTDGLFHYRDGKQQEIDLVSIRSGMTELIEVKSGQTPSSDWCNSLNKLSPVFGESVTKSVVFGGDEDQCRGDVAYRSWRNLP